MKKIILEKIWKRHLHIKGLSIAVLLLLLLVSTVSADEESYTGTITKKVGHASIATSDITIKDDEGNNHTVSVPLSEGEKFEVGDKVKVTIDDEGDVKIEKIEQTVAVPEFPSLIVPSLAALGIVTYLGRRRN